MKHAKQMIVVLVGAAMMTAGWLRAQEAAEPDTAAAVEDGQKVAELMAGKTAEEAAAVATKLMEDAIAKGGSDVAMRNRIAKLVAACIASSGANAPAVAAALVQAGGAERTGLVVAAITVAAKAAGLNVEEVTTAAVNAAAEAEKATAQDAVSDPAKYLGRLLSWRVENVARRFVEGGEPTTTTTTTTTTTVPSATPTAEQ